MTVTETPHAPGDLADRAPLSVNQEFLCMYDRGDDSGPFGPRHGILNSWRLDGAVDVGALRDALTDTVARHEALRTSVVRDDGVPYQRIVPPSPADVVVVDLSDVPPDARDARAEELLGELETRDYGVDELPLLRAVLGRFSDHDSVLAVISHHSAVDEWSMKLIIRDLAANYAARRGHSAPSLPEVHQYREYALWQHEYLAGGAAERSRRYWREKLQGSQMLALRTDYPRSANLPRKTAAYRFLIDEELTSAALELARQMRSSPFMVLLAAFNVLLRQRTGVADVVIPTLSSGRSQARFQETVGLFYNFVPLRTDVAGCTTFREVVRRTRATCIDAYSREIPFTHVIAEVPTLMAPMAEDDRAIVAFQVLQLPFVMEHQLVGDLAYSDVRRRLVSQPDTMNVPDGVLLQLDIDPSGDMVGFLGYNTDLFDDSTMRELIAEYRVVLEHTVAAPDAPLR